MTADVEWVLAGRSPERIRREAIEDNHRLNLWTYGRAPDGVRPVPPDGPIGSEGHYYTVATRTERLRAQAERKPGVRDLNGVLLTERIRIIESYCRSWDLGVETETLQGWERQIRILKAMLRHPWPGRGEARVTFQAARDELVWIKRRVQAVYHARYGLRQRRRSEAELG